MCGCTRGGHKVIPWFNFQYICTTLLMKNAGLQKNKDYRLTTLIVQKSLLSNYIVSVFKINN